MDALSKSLYSVVSQAVDEFSQRVAEKFDASKEEVLELWNSSVAAELKVVESSKPKEEKKAAAPRARAAKSESKDDSTAVCTYMFKKGKNINTTCTAKVCADSTKYCRKHKAQEEKEESGAKTEKKPAAKATKAKKEEAKEKETAAVKKLTEGKPSFVLRKNKQGNYEHPETHFVFDKVTKEVYGRQTDSGVEPLTTEDVDECRKFNFKCRLPDTLTSKKDESPAEDDEDVEEEDEEVDEEDEEEDEEVDDE